MVNKYMRDFDKTNLTLRLKSAEAVRFWKIMDIAKERNPYVDKSDVIRELIGLSEPAVLTLGEIEYFRKGKKSE